MSKQSHKKITNFNVICKVMTCQFEYIHPYFIFAVCLVQRPDDGLVN